MNLISTLCWLGMAVSLQAMFSLPFFSSGGEVFCYVTGKKILNCLKSLLLLFKK